MVIWLFAAVVGFPGRSSESQAEDQRSLQRAASRCWSCPSAVTTWWRAPAS
jgi:hypothetical protein